MINKTQPDTLAWSKALSRLSANAYYLLNVIYYKDFHITDGTLMEFTNLGMSSHHKYKRELVDAGYLSASQNGKGTYHYTIKDISNGK